jgi:hypothetical protein
MRQQVMVGLLALSVVAMLGATAARDLTARSQPSIWLDPSASDGLLASRLNITSRAKTLPTQ